MKKILVISSFFLILIAFSTIGYSIVSANDEINIIKDEIEYQKELDDYLTPYGYTLDNPNLIINPYDISPLTAILLFETEKDEEVTITIPGKDNNSTYINKFEKTNKHYIPIYGLYPDYNNIIHITCGKEKKTIEIKTKPLPKDLIVKEVNHGTNKLYFISNNNYTYALDSNNEVRWYLTKPYNNKITKLENGNLLLGNYQLNQNNKPIGLVEIDLLGKIVRQYNINNGYYGNHLEIEDKLLILSNNLIVLDKQTGTILKTYSLKNTYNSLTYDKETNIIILTNNEESYTINYITGETKHYPNKEKVLYNEESLITSFYSNNENYKIIKGIKFSTDKETKQSNKDIFLIGYKKIDDNYKNHKIKIKQTSDTIQINSILKKDEEIYIILDKFLDKRVYDIKDNQTIINKKGLSGKYSIYIKIDDTIYKTNTYINI